MKLYTHPVERNVIPAYVARHFPLNEIVSSLKLYLVHIRYLVTCIAYYRVNSMAICEMKIKFGYLLFVTDFIMIDNPKSSMLN